MEGVDIMNLELGKCYCFRLAGGAIHYLKFLGGEPLRWRRKDGTEALGPLDHVLGGQALVDWREVPCW